MVYKIQRLLFLLAVLPSLAQTNSLNNEDLSRLSYDELYQIMVSESDSVLLNSTFKIYVKKAINKNDTLQLAQAYRLRSYNLAYPEGIKSVDSSMTIAKTINHIDKKDFDEFMALAHYTKGALFYTNDMNYPAVEECIKSYQYARKTDNKKLVVNILIFIADIKAVYGQEDEAILLQRQTLNFLEANKTTIEEYENYYYYWTEQMSRCFLFSKELDSAAKYIDIGILLAKKTNDEKQLRSFKIQQSKLNFYLGNFEASKDSLNKYIEEQNGQSMYLEERNELSIADDLFYLGMIEGEYGNTSKKKQYFLKIDSIIKSKNYPLRDNFNEVYQFLLKEAISENDNLKTNEYLHRLVYYDSLLLTTQKQLREITLKKFDLPMQEEEKQMLGDIISTKSKWLTWFYVLSGIMLIGLSAYYTKYSRIKKRLAYALSHRIDLDIPTLLPERQEADDNKLDEEIVAKVLRNLKDWEEQKGFLDSNLTQQTLAKELNTNSAYLSQVINVHKKQNFASYLKDLRITYAINDLKSNPGIVQTKSMVQIAEMYGFNTVGVFSKAFKDKIGVTPGVFFKRIIEHSQRKIS
ncbi:helix-turn-helix domain-containing protein [Flagellimonas sediminis]|uniref:Helix-turn-helix domain-containing protein n=1 Tax=Flagellimonas sediminis TaxID=2696468 RepID=A0A6I5KQP0_9FLAO|nr:helix-turn-helix domain-containing protein [Allomuricauda sediminis]NDV42847.1 helix-turn-helix domain-containing protein [Allomuricauda sediminis]